MTARKSRLQCYRNCPETLDESAGYCGCYFMPPARKLWMIRPILLDKYADLA